MADSDLMERLLAYVNSQPIPAPVTIGYLGPLDQTTLCPLPGSQVLSGAMDGSITVSQPFEFSVQTKDQQAAYTELGMLYAVLSKLGIDIPSKNDSYEFEGLECGKPFLASQDESNKYILQMDVTVTITTKGSI